MDSCTTALVTEVRVELIRAGGGWAYAELRGGRTRRTGGAVT
jgi:hypothetical protein